MTTNTQYLLDNLNKTYQSLRKSIKNPEKTNFQQFKRPLSSKKLTKQKSLAKYKYEELTNMTKHQQQQIIWNQMISNKKNKKQWNHSFYQGNNKIAHVSKTFSVFNSQMEVFPGNNTKYNIQFLQRSLHGTNLKFPFSESGEFKKPSNYLYSKHYRPIVKEKKKFNEDWELRTSLFEKTWVDRKRDRIINKYEIQANPFKTPRSNSLISEMAKSQQH